MKYEPVIGIETHVQLSTASKLFCGCDNDSREAKPNQNVCPVCLGHPGSLPVLNARAVELVLRAGLALNAEIATQTKFDRKNYFYPDLPKGYQITQYDAPLVGRGQVEVPLETGSFKVGIVRAHLEEDAGKLTHPEGADYSLVDLNRAGTPLLEIVSEPDMHSAEQAKAYARELYHLMRYAGVSDADLFHGHMRFDVNVSLRPKGSKALGTRSETKNLNSFKAVERSVQFEIERQTALLESGEKVVQETRGWDENQGITIAQRGKEESHDYRYFPEPDLPPLVITPAMIKAAGKDFGDPQRPQVLRKVMKARGLERSQVDVLLSEPIFAQAWYEIAADAPEQWAQMTANWIALKEVQEVVLASDISLEQVSNNLAKLVLLADMVESGQLSATAGKKVAVEVVATGMDPVGIAERLNLIQISDTAELEQAVSRVLADNAASVADYHGGKDQALKFLVGQVMKATGGRANPPLVNKLLLKALKESLND